MTWLPYLLAFVTGVVISALVFSATRRAKPTRNAPGPYHTMIQSGLARFVSDDFAGAAQAWSEAQESSSEDASIALACAEALRRSGDTIRSERLLEVLATRKDLDSELRSALWLSLGRIFDQTDRAQEALAHFEQAAGLSPRSAAPLLALEQLLTRLRRWPEAIAASAKLQKLLPDRGKLITARRRVMYARELLAEGREKEALEQASAALGETPLLASAILTKGDALHQLGQRSAAKQSWLDAAREAPHITPLTLDRLEGSGSAVDRELARRFALDMIEREATGITSWRLYAWLADDALRRRDLGDARGWIERVEETQPRSATAQRLRVRLTQLEDSDRALRLSGLTARWSAERLWWDPWRCSRCGHSLEEFEWRCPHCQAWESFV
jgi:lipopolysaccharide biosynthesis regulator YciM